MKKKKYAKMFLVRYTVEGSNESVRINQDTQEEAEKFFRKMFAPTCTITEIIDITDFD
jgi:hypothetical protein